MSRQFGGSSRKGLVLAGVAVIVALISAAGALAVFPTDSVSSYAACLNTGGSAAGTFNQVAVGDSPAKACGSNQMLVHLSGGDITAVNAGAGLSGGATNGAATISLAAGQQMPQSCATGQLPKWNGSGWSCGNDSDTTYANGAGLDKDSANLFSISPSYRLPQNCSSGQITTWNGSSWGCADEQPPTSNDLYIAQPPEASSSTDVNTHTTVTVPAGSYLIVGKAKIGNSDSDGQYAHCQLSTGNTTLVRLPGEETDPFAGIVGHGAQGVVVMDSATFTATTTGISMDCHIYDGYIDNIVLTATHVGTIHHQ